MKDHPTIPDAKRFAQAHGLEGVLIVAFRNGQVCTISYGRTKEQCGDLKELNIHVSKAIEDGTVRLPSFDGSSCSWPMVEVGGEHDTP